METLMCEPKKLPMRYVALVACLVILAACDRGEDTADQPATHINSAQAGFVNGINVSINTLSCNDVVEMGSADPSTFLLTRAHVIERAFGQRLISIANEPHDCQPLIINPNDTLTAGPLLTVWAFENMRGIANRDVAVPVGAIVVEGVNVDPQALNLPSLTSCIWVRPSATAGWRAWLVPTDNRGCGPVPVDSVEARAGARSFAISRVTQPGFVGSRPIGARIIELPGRQYRIGFQCGDRWCVTMAPDSVADPANGILIRDVVGDWQRLHKYVNGRLVKTTLNSRLIPDPNLVNMTRMSDWEGDFHHVARIQFDLQNATSEDIAYYEGKLGIAPLTEIVTVEMLHEAKKPWATFWQIRYNGTSVKPAHWMGSNDLPGQARWKTHLRDEGVWVSCVFGCCGDQ
jgi:hypothetical protein